MATVIRNTGVNVVALATAHNSVKAQIGAGAHFHLDACERTFSSASATDLPTLIARVNEIAGILDFHMGDTLSHKVADPTDIAADGVIGAAIDLASAITSINASKAAYNVHVASTTYHYNADATNNCATADATDQASADTLANAMVTKVTAHMADAPSGASIRVIAM